MPAIIVLSNNEVLPTNLTVAQAQALVEKALSARGAMLTVTTSDIGREYKVVPESVVYIYDQPA